MSYKGNPERKDQLEMAYKNIELNIKRYLPSWSLMKNSMNILGNVYK